MACGVSWLMLVLVVTVRHCDIWFSCIIIDIIVIWALFSCIVIVIIIVIIISWTLFSCISVIALGG